MPISLFVSNNLDGLFNKLISEMEARALPVLYPYTIVSQTEGMNIWLKQNIAAKWGIASNLKFCKPNDILYDVYIILGGPFQVTMNRQSYVWILYEIIGSDEFKSKFPEPSKYLIDEQFDTDLKRLQLAEKIADLFDQYQIYRQEFIAEWSALKKENAPHWQAYLWASIIEAQQNRQEPLENIGFVRDFILKNIATSDKHKELAKYLSCVYLFGLSIFTKYHLEVFYKLSDYIDIQFYLINPSPYIYWGDDKSAKDLAIWQAKGYKIDGSYLIGNDLLINWGKLIQNTTKLLFQNDALIDAYEVVEAIQPYGATLLARIQNDIFENIPSSERVEIPAALLDDGSIQFHVHYTQQREVEGLYNYLCKMLVVDGLEIATRNILVVCSEIDTYAPYIDGVFANGPVKFKYKIADTSIAIGDNIFAALLSLLALNEEHFTLESVVALLDYSMVKNALGLKDIAAVKVWAEAANIKEGIKGNPNIQTHTISWMNGIKKMMYGICMSGTELIEDPDGDFFALDTLEGHAASDIIVFCDFALKLINWVQRRHTAKSIEAWLQYTEEAFQLFMEIEDTAYAEDLQRWKKIVEAYIEAASFYNATVTYDIFSKSFSQQLSHDVKSHLFYNDGITFCTVVPMRSIPFEVVAFLGMNDGKFPRKEQPLSFDLMQVQHQLGDRNIKDSDKHLFLETIISARSYVYISYIGRSAKDNSALNPSTLVDDLWYYIQEKAATDITQLRWLKTEHPLHNFSIQYNTPHNPSLYYFHKKNASTWTPKLMENVQQRIYKPPPVITLEKLAQFTSSPIAYYYKQVLGVYIDNLEAASSYHEPFVLNTSDALGIYKLRQQILEAQLAGTSASAFLLQQQLQGNVPLLAVGAHYVEHYWQEIAACLETKDAADAPESFVKHSVQLNIGQTSLEASLDCTSDGTLLAIIISSNTDKHIIPIFLKVLMGRATNIIHSIKIASTNPKSNIENSIIDLSDISAHYANEYLAKALQYFQSGHTSMIEMDHSFTAKFKSEEAVDEFFNKNKLDIKFQFESESRQKFNNQAPDAYLERFFRHLDAEALHSTLNSRAFVIDLILPILQFKNKVTQSGKQ